ncbi:hypothetical protein SAMN05216480_101570 [Pustulibacterium marinum]|uniref:HEAT repeat-containing protein n=1 Tax=Pustulibacterium marinum TaxID=1224947 RepID=A0A1I7F2W9_9FLAO|nr:HEAT repeat domain-containing protein [Pustulibacterium marinum]SFU30445.1 hypothetical protein SAMN05216480_101570 [Pustulibacterium marinum]
MKATITKLQNSVQGYQPIEGTAQDMFQHKTTADCFAYAYGFLTYRNEQIRSLGVCLLGRIAVKNPRALQVLRQEVSTDTSQRVQEALVRAFDYYCSTVGHAHALPVMVDWLQSDEPTVCKAAIRSISHARNDSFFRKYPEVAIQLIAGKRFLDDDDLQQTLALALHQLRQLDNDAVTAELNSWDRSIPEVQSTYEKTLHYLTN